jgi:hypothetical protein
LLKNPLYVKGEDSGEAKHLDLDISVTRQELEGVCKTTIAQMMAAARTTINEVCSILPVLGKLLILCSIVLVLKASFLNLLETVLDGKNYGQTLFSRWYALAGLVICHVL